MIKRAAFWKVTDIHIEPFQPAVGDGNPTGISSVNESMLLISATPANYEEGVHESSERISEGFSVTNGIEDFGSLEQLQQIQLLGLDDSRISEDVVSVPLDDIIQQVQPHKGNMQAGNDAVPLSDAPLIGAPFRLISFVARYVSGADLVDHDKPKAGC
ncbi:hypothetical protein HPP92_012541 [Vanilla planifolia]|uniref:Uncharacterized protein n=1 Tax=Vanilla planifolia TaxID=51239 RepID=A0A835R884_VANPL|nr:hypothetical protein HPP92_012541 [Vanilla planifolia]